MTVKVINYINLPEELKVQTSLGQEKLVILLEPDFAHCRVLRKHKTHIRNQMEKMENTHYF